LDKEAEYFSVSLSKEPKKNSIFVEILFSAK